MSLTADEGRQHLELVAFWAADWSSPEALDFSDGCGVIIIGADRSDVHGAGLGSRRWKWYEVSEHCNCRCIDTIILRMRAREFDESDLALEIERDDQSVLVVSGLESHTFAIDDFGIRERLLDVGCGFPCGRPRQLDPSLQCRLCGRVLDPVSVEVSAICMGRTAHVRDLRTSEMFAYGELDEGACAAPVPPSGRDRLVRHRQGEVKDWCVVFAPDAFHTGHAVER